MEKASHGRQNNVISKENILKSRMSATANECMHNGLDDKSIDKDSKVVNNDMWIQPKKVHTNNVFFNMQK